MTDDKPEDDDRPVLEQMGANQRDAPDGYNLDVSGTVGPDYLGQETTDVDGHPCDRPGVRSRLPESSGGDHPEISRMDTGTELPVLLSSDMRPDPIEGTQGTYTKIVEGHCVRCGYDRLRVSVNTLGGIHREECNACGARQDPRSDDGYAMPKTDEERAQREREAGEKLGSLTSRDVYDMEETSGKGPYVSLIGARSYISLPKNDVADLFFILVNNDDLDLAAEVNSRYRLAEATELLLDTVPEVFKPGNE